MLNIVTRTILSFQPMQGHSDFPLYDGSYLASHSNIIVVTMNYRLGALGFLVFHDKHHDIRGNFAIKVIIIA